MTTHNAFDHIGPTYPELGATVAKLRAASRRDPSKSAEHGAAVLAAVYRMNRDALKRELPSVAPNCASGTPHADGASILAAVRRQHLSALHSGAARDRKRRTDDELRRDYARAMAEKRAAMDCAA